MNTPERIKIDLPSQTRATTNVVTPEGVLYMIPDADTSKVSGHVLQTDDFTIEGDYLLWNGQEIDLNQDVS
jgi:hypothetical protein